MTQEPWADFDGSLCTDGGYHQWASEFQPTNPPKIIDVQCRTCRAIAWRRAEAPR